MRKTRIDYRAYARHDIKRLEELTRPWGCKQKSMTAIDVGSLKRRAVITHEVRRDASASFSTGQNSGDVQRFKVVVLYKRETRSASLYRCCSSSSKTNRNNSPKWSRWKPSTVSPPPLTTLLGDAEVNHVLAGKEYLCKLALLIGTKLSSNAIGTVT